MIDFRYHLVSLVAVFMALAVGIVLGAGPLGQEISSTLEAQVRELREERNDLRSQLDQAQQREELKDRVVQIVTPSVVANQLAEQRIAVLALPGSDRNIVDRVQDQFTSAGAQVVVTTRVEEAWADPEGAATRHEIAAELEAGLAEPEPRTGSEPTVETIIAATVAGRDEVPGSQAWRTAEDRLEEHGLIRPNWGEGQLADAVVVPPDAVVIIPGSLDTQTVEEDEDGPERLEQSLDLIAAFGELGVPTVVTGYGTDSYSDPVQAAQSPVVRGLRAEAGIASTVSSVDNVETAAGRLAAVLALRWSIDDEPGHWGMGTDAEAPAPAVPTPLQPAGDESLIPPPSLPGDEEEDGGADGATGDETDAATDGATGLPGQLPTGLPTDGDGAGTGGDVGPTGDPNGGAGDTQPTTGAPTP